jgi:hypothetical protein
VLTLECFSIRYVSVHSVLIVNELGYMRQLDSIIHYNGIVKVTALVGGCCWGGKKIKWQKKPLSGFPTWSHTDDVVTLVTSVNRLGYENMRISTVLRGTYNTKTEPRRVLKTPL